MNDPQPARLPELALRIHRSQAPSVRGRRGGIWRRGDGEECGRSFVDGDRLTLEWNALGTFRTESASLTHIDAWPLAGVDDETVSAHFHADIEPIFLQALGWETLHASAVLGPSGVVAFCGASGSGKSTIAFAMRESGWPQIADDHLVLRVSDAAHPRACSRAFVVSLRRPSADYFALKSQLTSAAVGNGTRLAHIVILEQSGELDEEVTVEPIQPARAFSAILPHAHCFDPSGEGATERLTRRYLNLAATVPVHRVRYRRSFERLPYLVEQLRRMAGSRAESLA